MPFARLLSELDGAGSAAAPPPPTPVMLRPPEVAVAIATRSLVGPAGEWNLELSPQAVSALLAGRPTEVPASSATDTRSFLVAPMASVRDDDKDPTDPTDGGPIVAIQLRHSIAAAELPVWLADPWVFDESGQKMSLTLKPSHVRNLTTHGHATVSVPGYDVQVVVTSAPKSDTGATGGTGPGTGTVTGTTGSTGTTSTEEEKPDSPGYDPERVLEPAGLDQVVLAVYFEWHQTWTLTGFSRGRLLQSLALAPQEDTTIELFTWDRRRKTLEQSSSTETEQTMEDEEKTQDSTEVMREITKKDEFELKLGARLDVRYNGGTVNVKLGAEGEAITESNVEDVTKNTTKTISEAIHKSSAKVRTQRSSKVTETTEVGSEQRITRRVRNPNLCHTIDPIPLGEVNDKLWGLSRWLCDEWGKPPAQSLIPVIKGQGR